MDMNRLRAQFLLSSVLTAVTVSDPNANFAKPGRRLGTHADIPTASEQILTNFMKSPEDIRNLIYAEMNNVENQRLLINHHHLSPPPEASRLPLSLFLNKEAFLETRRVLKFISRKERKSVPWLYINPKFDTVYSFYVWNIPTTSQAPGLQTLAVGVSLSDWDVSSHPSRFMDFEEELFKRVRGLTDLKELLLIRNTLKTQSYPGALSGRRDVRFSTEFDSNDANKVPYIQRHPCGFFGLVNDAIEDLEAEPPRNLYGNISRNPNHTVYKRSEVVLEDVKEFLKNSYEQADLGRAIPEISVAYDHWVNPDGTWNSELGTLF